MKTTNERKSSFPNNRGPNQYRNPGTSSALYIRERDNTYNSNKIRCAYCRDYHFSASCERIKDLKQRKEILRKEGWCFVCLRIGHRGSECQRACRRCNGKHHQSICMKSTDSYELVTNLKRFGELESLGIVEKDENPVFTDVLRDITFNGNRYEVRDGFTGGVRGGAHPP